MPNMDNCSALVDLVAVRMLASILSAPNASTVQWVHETPAAQRGQQFLSWHCCNPHVPATYVCSAAPHVPKDWPHCPDYASSGGLVYSFGIDNQWGFDDAAADRGQEVHSFDPTVKNLAKHSAHAHPRVTFHPWGLAADSINPACNTAPSGGYRHGHGHGQQLVGRRSDPGGRGRLADELFTLPAIRERLGHTSRRISTLKIDCEGCEWEIFAHMPISLLEDIDVLLVEVHPALLMSSDSDLALFGSFFRKVFLEAGFRVWWQHPNSGGKDRPGVLRSFHPMLNALGLDPLVCCYELALVRPTGQGALKRARHLDKLMAAYAEEAAKSRGVPHPCPDCLGN